MKSKVRIKKSENIKVSDLSLDEKFVFYRDKFGFGVVNVVSGEEVFREDDFTAGKRNDLFIPAAVFYDLKNQLLYAPGTRLRSFDPFSMSEKIGDKYKYTPLFSTLINKKSLYEN